MGTAGEEMGGFLRALAKVGLVELEDGDSRPVAGAAEPEMSQDQIAKILAETRSIGRTEGKDPPTTPAEPAEASERPRAERPRAASEVVEGVAFEDVYRGASLTPSPFPAEKLLKLLDGLRTMDEKTRKAAVLAMDSADESWKIEDPLLDAKRKIEALARARAALRQSLADSESKAKEALEARARYQDEATATIRQQIAELEATLEKEVAAMAEEKATIKAKVEADRAAVEREEARFDAEIRRLQEIGKIFHTAGEGS
jgi:flagellar biosynthesis GTPase FlhF